MDGQKLINCIYYETFRIEPHRPPARLPRQTDSARAVYLPLILIMQFHMKCASFFPLSANSEGQRSELSKLLGSDQTN